MIQTLLFLVLASLLASPAFAAASAGEPVVYHSPGGTGAPPETTPWVIEPQDDQLLHLYIDYENVPDAGASCTNCGTTMCVDADGDETCGFDVLLELQSDGGSFESFTPAAGGIVGLLTAGTATAPATLRVNGIDTTGMPIPAPIGTLEVDAAGANQLQITVKGLHRVGAAGQLDAIQERVIVRLPEPGQLAQAASGLVALGWLARRRGRVRARR